LSFAVIAIPSVLAQDPPLSPASFLLFFCPLTVAQSPFFIVSHIVLAGQINTPPLVTLGPTSGTTLTYVPTLPAGTAITFIIRDAIGRTSLTGPSLSVRLECV
ncbi:hypothetical protein CPB85DRAFT_1321052, partial [Mucidula mucida]